MLNELIFCKDCINAKPKQGLNLQYCNKHRRYITEHTVINSYRDDKVCKDFVKKGGKP